MNAEDPHNNLLKSINLCPNPKKSEGFRGPSKIEVGGPQRPNQEGCHMTQDWTKLAGDLERLLKLRAIPFGMTLFDGKSVFAGGENTFGVYRIDMTTGEPVPIQHIDTRGIHCRTFHIDPSGRILVAAHIMALPVREGAAIRIVPASLAVFRIDDGGKLDFVRKYDVDVGDLTLMFWMGMVPQ